MLQYGNDSGLPETYRITLAVSVAFLVHTLAMATFPYELPEHTHNPVSVSVQLMPQGSAPSRESAPSSASPTVRATPFTIGETPTSRPDRIATATSSLQPQAASKPEATVDQPAESVSPTQTERQLQPAQKATSSSSAPATARSTAGKQAPQQKQPKAEVTLKSDAPSEDSSYISLLSQTISRKVQIRALDDLQEEEILSVEVELNLMSNGALVGAKVTRSSGNNGLDQRVYRAALAASPYPEPPSSTGRQQQFRVPFFYKFQPKRP